MKMASNTNEIVIIDVTIDSEDGAIFLATRLVEEKYAACVNYQQCSSIFTWEGKLEQMKEYHLQIKTLLALKKECIDWLVNNHPYDTPSIVSHTVQTEESFYLWMKSVCR